MKNAEGRTARPLAFSILRSSLLLLPVALAACQPASPPAPVLPKTLGVHPVTTRSIQPQDASSNTPLVAQLMVYQVTVPLGSVSRNERFWKHVDEQVVGADNYDLLYKNGIRVGVAPNSEWDYFKQIIEQNPARSQSMSYVATEARSVEVLMKGDVPVQTVFDFDATNHLTGRTYDASDNILTVSFEPNRRKPGDLRVALCPLVRSQRKEYVVQHNGDSIEVTSRVPEHYYRVNLAAEIPLDHLLIIAASPEARFTTTLGYNFFVLEDPAEQVERLLVLVPRMYRVNQGTE